MKLSTLDFNFKMFLDIDDCVTNPCLNDGVCVDGVNAFTCKCAHGFRGDTCGISKFASILKFGSIFIFKGILLTISFNIF